MTQQIITKAERDEKMARQDAERIQRELPSRWQMLKNLVQAAAEAVKGGLDVRGPEEMESVLKICAECPRLIIQEERSRCGECGCFLGGKTPNGGANGIGGTTLGKTSLKSWHCPLGKW